jgi:hypothetical protein
MKERINRHGDLMVDEFPSIDQSDLLSPTPPLPHSRSQDAEQEDA